MSIDTDNFPSLLKLCKYVYAVKLIGSPLKILAKIWWTVEKQDVNTFERQSKCFVAFPGCFFFFFPINIPAHYHKSATSYQSIPSSRNNEYHKSTSVRPVSTEEAVAVFDGASPHHFHKTSCALHQRCISQEFPQLSSPKETAIAKMHAMTFRLHSRMDVLLVFVHFIHLSVCQKRMLTACRLSTLHTSNDAIRWKVVFTWHFLF